MPRSVRSVVGQRVGRLAPGRRRCCGVASVLGQEWDLAVLLAAGGTGRGGGAGPPGRGPGGAACWRNAGWGGRSATPSPMP